MQVEQIKRIFKTNGIKNTQQRQMIYGVLIKSKVPIPAERIYQLLMESGLETLNLSTIYRVLDLFTQKGLVIKSSLSIDDRATYEINHNEHRHHLSCISCGAIKPINGCPLHDYETTLIEATGYQVIEHRLEILGICPKCQKK